MNQINIQIIGTKNCSETRKAERFFKERKISYHFRDLNEKGLTKGELENIKAKIPLEDLIDKEGKQYKKRNLQFMVFDIEEQLLSDPLLLKTPIVRNNKEVTLGYQPEIWKNWLKQSHQE
ncbi:MAG: arsenate reductase family protein [Melioribacter sp.]|nr:arsenate reductase family protein [Melioribacter sp.]